MPELTEEDRELLEKMSRQVKKEENGIDKQTKETTQKTAKQLTEEYYKDQPDKRPYLRKKRDALKKMRAESKQQRAEERRIYKEEYQKQKKKTIRKRAERRAKARYGYTVVEKVTGSIKRPPSMHKKPKTKPPSMHKKPKTKPKTRQTQRQPQQQQPRMISFDDAIGSFGQPRTQQKRTTQPKYSNKIDFGSEIGSFGTKNKKQKPIDPFKKLF